MRVLDPVHKYMSFSEGEERIIDSEVFQRLRDIRQLGFSEWAFPGAVHNRFLHSLGVAHLAGRAFDIMFGGGDLLPESKKKQFRQVLRLAALLHDVGHGPFSHSSEEAMPPAGQLHLPHSVKTTGRARHEHYTLQFLLHSELTPLTEALDTDPLLVAHLLDSRIPVPDRGFFKVKGIDFQPLLKQLISSDLDMDRMDYLQRDAYFCGVDYGFCDPDWILHNIQVHVKEGRAFLAVRSKAIYSVENFLLGRRHISLAVYFHNKMVAMEEMLYQYFKSHKGGGFVLPSEVKSYISCTDSVLVDHLKSHRGENDLARRLLRGQAYKRVFEVRTPDEQTENRESKPPSILEMENLLSQKGVPFLYTHSLKRIKKLYCPPEGGGGEDFPIYIVEGGEAVPLRQRLKMFHQIHFMEPVHRLYAPEEDIKKLKQDPLINKNKGRGRGYFL